MATGSSRGRGRRRSGTTDGSYTREQRSSSVGNSMGSDSIEFPTTLKSDWLTGSRVNESSRDGLHQEFSKSKSMESDPIDSPRRRVSEFFPLDASATS